MFKICVCSLLENAHHVGINCEYAKEVAQQDKKGNFIGWCFLCASDSECTYQRETSPFDVPK